MQYRKSHFLVIPTVILSSDPLNNLPAIFTFSLQMKKLKLTKKE